MNSTLDSQASTGEFPNLVYVLADDMGYGDLGCNNPRSRIPTPSLDRLAKEGMRFTDAHASSSVCTPSRYSILTGRYNWRSALKEGVTWGYSLPLIEPGRLTVAELLRGQGYRTACIGKWHLGWEWARTGPAEDDVDFTRPIRQGPCSFGFDHFFGISASLDMPPYVYVEDEHVTAVPDRVGTGDTGFRFWRPGPIGSDFRHEEVLPRLTDHAVAWLESEARSGHPFFLYFALPAPHTPILPSAEFLGRSGTNVYGDFCMMVDAVVGRLMDTLRRTGVENRTIVLFAADNGCSPMADLRGLARMGHFSSYVFRGHKADIFEGGHRIPLLVRWPDRIQTDTVCEETVCLVDLMATMADVLSVRLPEGAGEDSVSLSPLWEGRRSGTPIREATVHHSVDGSFSIRKGRWKLALCSGSGGWSWPRPGPECRRLPPIQLYDLETDEGEWRNVQALYPDVVKLLKTLLARYVRQGRSTPGTPQPNTGPLPWPQLAWMDEGSGRS